MDKASSPGLNGDMRVSELIDGFLAVQSAAVTSGEIRPGTLDFYRHQLRKLAAVAGDHPAAELRAHHLAGRYPFTHHSVRALKRLFRWALEEDLIPKDYFRRLKTPRCGARRRILTRAELVKLYRASSRPYRRLLMAARHTMARPGELRALRWRDVHLERRLILLWEFKAKERRRDGQEVRKIPLTLPLVRLLSNMRKGAGPEDFVFLGREGKPLTANAVRCAIRRARAAAGLGPDDHGERIVCYTIRHTSATNATRRGLVDRRLADILGHTNTRTTARYQHLDGADLVEALDLIPFTGKGA